MTHDVSVTGRVRASIDKVWTLFRPFGKPVESWWVGTKQVSIDPPGADEVGCVRTFASATGYTYKEKLITADSAAHCLQYQLVSSTPAAPLETVITTVQMTATDDGETDVSWSSDITGASPAALPQIKALQAKAYAAAIHDLDSHFHPYIGRLKVEIKHATGLSAVADLAPRTYVVAAVSGDHPKITSVAKSTREPIWDETLDFDLLPDSRDLSVQVWNANPGVDTPLGQAQFRFSDLKSGQRVLQTIALSDGGELVIGLTLALIEGETLPHTAQEQKADYIEHLVGIIERLKAEAHSLILQLSRAGAPTIGYATYTRLPWDTSIPLEEMPKLTDGLPPSELLSPKILGGMFTRQFEYLAAQRGIMDRLALAKDPFRVFFNDAVRVPDFILDHANDDAEMCRQLLQGANPHCIAVVTDPRSLPDGLRALTPQGQDLASLSSARRLFVCDYEKLLAIGDAAEIKRVGYHSYAGMVTYAPILLVYKHVQEGKEDELRIAGIQLTRHEDRPNDIYTPDSDRPNKYKLAKMHTACADMQYQEWIYHLGLAHLINEPFAIARHNAFQAPHAIGQFLEPHYRDTIGINFLARRTLVSPVTPFTDKVFSPGCAGALKMVLAAWKSYDFFKFSGPELLAARGFDGSRADGIDGYYYRDDTLLLWDAIFEYAKNVVDETYPDDNAVAADPVLTKWAQEMTDPARAGVPGFPMAFDSKALLVRTLTVLIHNSSAMHSAVNYPQMDYQAYLPNRSPSLVQAVPEGAGDVDDALIRATYPGQFTAHFQAMFSYILTLPGQQPLTELVPIGPRYVAAHEAFQRRLREIEDHLNKRNAELAAKGKVPYVYLLPTRVASSVAI